MSSGASQTCKHFLLTSFACWTGFGVSACAGFTDEAACIQQPMLGGSAEERELVDNDGQSGVVGIVVHDAAPDVSRPRYCSGGLLRDGTIVSARHCFAHEGAVIEVGFGPNVGHWTADAEQCRLPSPLLRATISRVHPSLDLSLLAIEQSGKIPRGLGFELAESTPAVGAVVVLGGFGASETGIGTRRFLRSVVSSLDNGMIEVDSEEREGPCEGDSGSPLLVRDSATGRWSIAGVLSQGSASCMGPDDYVSLVGLDDWP